MTQMFAIRIEGPDGAIVRAQIFANVRKMRAEWMPDIWEAVGSYARQVVLSRQFESQGGHLGSPWDALSAKYLRWKEIHGYSMRIGVRTGAMRQAMTSKTTRKGARKLRHKAGSAKYVPILNASADGVTIGGEAHEDGKGEYSHYFDMRRKIFGKQNLSSRDEIEVGKMLTLPFVAAAHTKEAGAPETADLDIAGVTARFVAKTRIKRFAA